MAFTYVSGRACLDFMGTLKYRGGAESEELLNGPECLSEWALHGGLVGAAVGVTEEDLRAAIAVREAGYRVVTARLERRRPAVADVGLINEWAARPRLTPRLLRTGATRREGTAAQLLATLAADLLDLLAGTDVDNVKRCAHPGCTRLYVDSSRGHNRHWCGMSTCGNKAKVQAFRARQRASAH
jgi:predicted RNA-binding Zn ribbon-like protein